MAITSGFFNSVNGDRIYNAEQINDYLTGLVGKGVYESVGGRLQVKSNAGMKVQVASGKVTGSDGKWLNNDSTLVLTLDAADLVLNRYDAIVAKLDSNQNQRTGTITIKKGTVASTPTKPTAERTQFVEEYILAYVYVGKGVTAITQAQIEDTRANTSICGFVTGLIKQVDTSQLFLQYQTAYAQFLNELNQWKSDQKSAFDAWRSQQKSSFDTWFTSLTDELRIDTYIESAITVWNDNNPLQTVYLNDRYREGDVVFIFINGLLATNNIDYTITNEGAENDKVFVLRFKKIIYDPRINPVTYLAIRSKIGSQPT